ncbi:MAG TPA: DMT family transporter [Burkholderiaceae bacterium]|nr:DMT family transporter [Burkholderiaceae bacterium]
MASQLAGRAALALVFNALVWGLSWWPLRQLDAQGVHPLWATVLIYAPTVLVIAAWRPRAVGQLLTQWPLWVLALAAGLTNAAFNWGTVIGDVVRVVLLFYLMPLWSVLLARVLLKEPVTLAAGARIALAVLGAGIVLRPEGATGWAVLPFPQSLADGLGLLGGFTFALNNVMLKREADRPEEGRALAMFVGGAVVAGALAAALSALGRVPWPLAGGVAALPWWAIALALTMSVLFLCSNLALQFGASRLPIHVTSVLMLSEVLVAAGSAALLGAGRITVPLLLGGAMIVAAAVWATRDGAH